jgi:tRNA-binding EMAP/Myf-like protein
VLSFEAEPQSNGKTIRWCQVDVGEAEPRGIVCGASNFFAGDKVVVSLPGAVLPGPFPISARKTYGHVSDGMIASARELGLGDEHNGILRLAELGLDPQSAPTRSRCSASTTSRSTSTSRPTAATPCRSAASRASTRTRPARPSATPPSTSGTRSSPAAASRSPSTTASPSAAAWARASSSRASCATSTRPDPRRRGWSHD